MARRVLGMTLALCLVAPGCASPDVPAWQTVRVQTPGCAVASCELSNEHGSWPLARTPGSVAVRVSGEPLRVSCRADESTVAATRAASARPATSGTGAVVGGVAGATATGVALGSTALAFIPPLGVVAVLTGAAVGAVAGDAAQSRRHALRYPGLISLPMACAAGGEASGDAPRAELGLTIRGLTASEAQALGLDARTAVMVLAVAADGRAAAAGLRQGDVIVALDGQDVADAADLEEQVLARPPAAPLALRLWRDRRVVEVVLRRASMGPS